ncbi:hypothetical protein Tco_0477738 [Tanacetum coccineum]
MINKCLTGKATTYDHPRLPMLQLLWGMVTGNNNDFANLIRKKFKSQIESRKLDPTLGNLKFANKGKKDPVFRMPFPALMLNDDDEVSLYTLFGVV